MILLILRNITRIIDQFDLYMYKTKDIITINNWTMWFILSQ